MSLTPAELARAFHEAYERLAPAFDYETRRESAVPWADVPENNKALMAAVVAEVVLPLLDEAQQERDEALERLEEARVDTERYVSVEVREKLAELEQERDLVRRQADTLAEENERLRERLRQAGVLAGFLATGAMHEEREGE